MSVGATGHRMSCFAASYVFLPAPNLTTECHMSGECDGSGRVGGGRAGRAEEWKRDMPSFIGHID
jgi:hypothetical protein